MNPKRLLAHFDRIAEAPNAVMRLRQLVLEIAVRGKLVQPDGSAEPVSDLLKRIQSQRRRHGASLLEELGKIEPAFPIPAAWAWVSLSAVAESRLGKMLDKSKNKGVPRRYIRNTNVRWFDFDLSDVFEMRFEDAELDEFSLRCGDVLVCEGGEPGRAAIWDEREKGIYFQKALHRVRLLGGIVPAYFVRVLWLDAISGRLEQFFTGTGIKHLTGKGLSRYSFPLPPIAEQHRIVAKVDELMALCDRLEVAQAERERRRGRLLEALLHEALEDEDVEGTDVAEDSPRARG